MDYIVKLGGSVITKKDEPFTKKEENIKRLSEEISKPFHEGYIGKLCVTHGGGSYGHPVAEKYKILEGLKSKRQVFGYSKTEQKMKKLNEPIVDALQEYKIPALPYPVLPFLRAEGGEPREKKDQFETLNMHLKEGFVLVYYGTPALDDKKGCTILSTDKLNRFIAPKIDSEQLRVISVTDVDGVYTSNPKVDPDAKFIKTIRSEEVGNYKIRGSLETDVTGGMMEKVEEACELASLHQITTKILNGNKPGRLEKALKGEEVKSTDILS